MCKKLGIAALVIVAGLFTLNKLDLLWHVKDAARKAKAELRSKIPTEDKIARLKDELAKLKPEKNKHLGVIAEESFKIDKLEKEVEVAQANLDKWQKQIVALKTALDNDNAAFISLGGDKLPREKVKAVFTRKVEDYEAAKEANASQKSLIVSRKEKLELAEQKLRTMEAKEKEMTAKVAKLEIELAKLRDAQMQHDIAIDDGQFSKVVQLFNEIEDQIGKEKKVLQLQKGVDSDSRVEEAANDQVRYERALRVVDSLTGGDTKVASDKK